MQVSTNYWTHPAAAAAAQSSTQAKKESSPPPASPNGFPSAEIAVTDVEGATKPGDRDADGQYLAQQHEGASCSQEPPPLQDTTAQAYTELPADDGESHALDCWG